VGTQAYESFFLRHASATKQGITVVQTRAKDGTSHGVDHTASDELSNMANGLQMEITSFNPAFSMLIQ